MVRRVVLLWLALAACSARTSSPPPVVGATGSGSGTGSAAAPAASDDDDDAYVPAEFKTGADRWRDTGVYVDGVFQGLLAWAELPLALEPTWLKVQASAPKKYGSKDTGWRWAKERRYRFTDYLEAIGLDLAKVREIHVYGPKFTDTIVVTGRELRTPLAKDFMFRFSGLVSGKAIPAVPEGLGNGKSPDKISAVMVYVDKAPPTLVRNVGMMLDGQVTTGVPYFGTPHRGGVRVYLDDRLVAYLKRQELPLASSTPGPDGGDPRWSLFEMLRAQGVATDKIVEAHVVRDERWHERLDRAALEAMWFTAGMQAKGNIELGDAKIKAQALVLRSTPLDAQRVPTLDPEEL
ncbi:MAG: hypothetical protein R2939_19760 [Kofleriaceae bacterium]